MPQIDLTLNFPEKLNQKTPGILKLDLALRQGLHSLTGFDQFIQERIGLVVDEHKLRHHIQGPGTFPRMIQGKPWPGNNTT